MRAFCQSSRFLCWVFLFFLTSHAACAAEKTTSTTSDIPVWIYDSENFEFWRDEQGHYQGYFQELITAFNEKYGYRLTLAPISGEAINQRFEQDAYGVYAAVVRTDERLRKKNLSIRLFDNEVIAASLMRVATQPSDLQGTRVIFRRDDATPSQIMQRYPELQFNHVIRVDSSEEAFTLLRQGAADFYINDDSEMDDPQHYYTLSRPFSDLRSPCVMAFSPEFPHLRTQFNQLIAEWQQNGALQALEDSSKRRYLLSRIRISPQEKDWLENNRLTVWLPKNENFVPLIWKDETGYHGAVMDMLTDLTELLHINVDVKYVDNYVLRLQEEQWPIRLVNIVNSHHSSTPGGKIGPSLAWHNAYYNRIGQPFIWDEEQVRYKRVGVIRGSFNAFYLRQRFGDDVMLYPASTVEELVDAIEHQRIDFILGDLNSLEGSLRGNDLFRDVLKVAGLTREEYQIGSWVDERHPLHPLLTQIHLISSYRSQMERHSPLSRVPEFSKNTFKIISLILLTTVLFSMGLLWLMWRQMKKNQAVNRSIVEAMEKVNLAHDDETGNHIQRVAAYCDVLASELGLSRKTVKDIGRFASLHDVGKIAIPEHILRKQGPLTAEEFAEMKLHTLKGRRIIQGLGLGPIAENIIHYHHEKWDGSGYPEGLRGEQIPIEARILALADVYDALRQPRIYKPGFTHEHACSVIIAGSGGHFDPQLVHLFRHLQHRFRAIFDNRSD